MTSFLHDVFRILIITYFSIKINLSICATAQRDQAHSRRGQTVLRLDPLSPPPVWISSAAHSRHLMPAPNGTIHPPPSLATSGSPQTARLLDQDVLALCGSEGTRNPRALVPRPDPVWVGPVSRSAVCPTNRIDKLTCRAGSTCAHLCHRESGCSMPPRAATAPTGRPQP